MRMKKLISLIGIAILSVTITSCGYSKADQSEPDRIHANKLGVKRSSSSAVNFGATTQEVSNSFGPPSNSYTEYWEMQEKDALVYDFDGCKLHFLENQLESYELFSPALQVGDSSNGEFFAVGNNLSQVVSYLPNWSSNKNDGTLSANITSGGKPTDEFLYIEFNPSTEIITGISIRSY